MVISYGPRQSLILEKHIKYLVYMQPQTYNRRRNKIIFTLKNFPTFNGVIGIANIVNRIIHLNLPELITSAMEE